MGLDLVFTLQNMRSENQDLYVPFCYETKTLPFLCFICPLIIKIYMYTFFMRSDTTFTLQNMPFENQDLYVPFCYGTGYCFYFAEHAL